MTKKSRLKIRCRCCFASLRRFFADEKGSMNLQSLMVLAIAATILTSYLYIRDDLMDFGRWNISYLIELVDQGYEVSK